MSVDHDGVCNGRTNTRGRPAAETSDVQGVAPVKSIALTVGGRGFSLRSGDLVPSLRINRETRDPPLLGGLYDPGFEHDGCGVAFVANVSGHRSHAIVQLGIEALVNLGHRGASGCDPTTGDGAGLLVQLPDAFLRRVGPPDLPAEYGVGMTFLPSGADERAACENIVDAACEERGLRVFGWRDVPVNPGAIGRVARESMPVVRQFFVAAAGLRGNALERRLYIVRRIIERRGGETDMGRTHSFYISSLSCRTVVYKGMLSGHQITGFYPDLLDPDFMSAIALVHERFSTNVLPRWDLAQPFRFAAHNGEINTLRGNVNWMRARSRTFRSPLFGSDVAQLGTIIDETGSDSAQFDNALELLVQAGRPIEHAMMMMIPEAWQHNETMDPDLRALYEFHSALLEPWDGPAAFAFSDGRVIGATLDRNGLRPARYLVTDDGMVVMASEAGVLDIAPERIVRNWRLEPGKLLLVDTVKGVILNDAECKLQLARAHPYRRWVREGTIHLDELVGPAPETEPDPVGLLVQHQAFGYTEEDIRIILSSLATDGEEPVGSMGNDTPPAVLSDQPLPLFNYFKQLFAQVTNPPIDPIRESMVMSLATSLGAGGNLLDQGPAAEKRLKLPHPILTTADLGAVRHMTQRVLPAATVQATFHRGEGAAGLEAGLQLLCDDASRRVAEGSTIIVVSDRRMDSEHVPIPSLLACAAVHHHLVREGTRTGVGLVVESGEPREVMHIALLIGYGAEAVNPYLALDSVRELEHRGLLPAGLTRERAQQNMVTAYCKGLLKTISKMGISTILSYCGAQIFEAVGIAPAVIDRYFTGTPSRIGGIGLEVIAADALTHHEHAFPERPVGDAVLRPGGQYQWRRDGEQHAWNPETIGTLQHAVKTGDSAFYREYAALVDDENRYRRTLRGLLTFRPDGSPVPLDEVEPATSIVRRFATGAMSFGSISKEAHETLAIAMNRIGGRSNTGEGGEDANRFAPDANGDWRRSAIKQVASARFGVTAHYLVNADELQIKIAQGAKPGEGGQLPGHKVDEYIAQLRHSIPGVSLISPPPHHDIYSIEDLAQLIHDLKNVNPAARISVKLVAEVGVGTVAAGVAKAHADHIVISGYDGGTGASPLSSIKHAGTPWEIGLAEAQQVLIGNDLRSRVVLQADGQMKTGRDVVVAALLGAEEFGFATSALIASGCIMMRVCHLNTCPVGIATQDPRLRRRFAGRPENIINFMFFLAGDVREHMAALGFRRFEDMVGRTDLLGADGAVGHWKARGLDFSRLLHHQTVSARDGEPVSTRQTTVQDHGLEGALDHRLIALAQPALQRREPVHIAIAVSNRHRSVGAMLSGEVARRHGAVGLPPDTIRIDMEGTGGQSFGAWLAAGITLTLRGEANDYIGKGLSGGSIAVRRRAGVSYAAEENIVIGNVALYGATAGEGFFNGVAGERFGVRNSGAVAVVEGVGDHGCEYMTGGTVVVLGRTGRNFAAGMSGGVAYVFDADGGFADRCNRAMVGLGPLGGEEAKTVRALVEQHQIRTGSEQAGRLLADWDGAVRRFVTVMPEDYQRVLREQRAAARGMAG